MHGRFRTLAVLCLAAAGALALAASAVAAEFTTHSQLRVEAGGDPLEPGANYSNGSIRSTNSSACGQRNSRYEQLRGANATGLVGHAARVNQALPPFRTGDAFEDTFGLVLCQIASFQGFGSNYWLYNLNHVAGTIGGDQQPVRRGDEVLWYYVECTQTSGFECVDGRNYGRELGLRAPARSEPGDPFTVTALTYTASGAPRPEAGVQVSSPDGTTTAVTDGNGQATIVLTESTRLRATRQSQGDIPSAPLEVCVEADLSRCPARRGEAFFGTERADRIVATRGADTIRPRGDGDVVSAGEGDDFVNVRRGGRDDVDCGPGRDAVRADARDRLSGCERRA